MDDPIKVLMVGNFRVSSFASQGLTFNLLDELKKHINAEFTYLVIDKYYKQDIPFAEKHGIKLISHPYPKFIVQRDKIINAIKNADVVIDADGIEFIGNRSIKRRWFHYFATSYLQWVAQKQGKLYIKYTKSYGPFPTPGFRQRVKNDLNKLPFLFVRGDENLNVVKGLGLTIPLYSFPDVSLGQNPASKTWATKYVKKLGVDVSKPFIGISPSTVISNQSLFAKKTNCSCGANHVVLTKKLIEYFQKDGKQVLLIPQGWDDGENLISCDLALIKKVYEELENKKNIFYISDMSLEYSEMRAIVGLTDFYITGRYHGLCSGLNTLRPVVSLAWHMKYQDAMSLFFDKYLVVDCRANSVDDAFELIKKYYKDRSWYNKTDMKKRKDVVVNLVNENVKILADEIKRYQNERTITTN